VSEQEDPLRFEAKTDHAAEPGRVIAALAGVARRARDRRQRRQAPALVLADGREVVFRRVMPAAYFRLLPAAPRAV
jgi:hypothetical protein